MTAAAGRHPSDADRERAARPVLDQLLRAAREGDGAALAACYADDAAWLDGSGTRRGRDAAAARHREIARPGTEWAAPQQQGARAVLRWSRPADAGAPEERGAIVVEVRRQRVIFAAAI